MLGAMVGDIVGSVYEFDNIKTKNFPLFREDCFFTDDTVMTIAVRRAILSGYGEEKNLEGFKGVLVSEMQRLGQKYPGRGYGGRFAQWLLMENPKPYGSFGNGSAMRVSPVGEYADSLEEALQLAKASAEVTHNHREGIKGAQAVAAAIYLAKAGMDKSRIRRFIESDFYLLDFTVDEIRDSYGFDETCQGSVPQALVCFFDGTSFEDVIRNCISIGGDCDTTAAIAGGIAESLYGVPEEIAEAAMKYLTDIEDEIV